MTLKEELERVVKVVECGFEPEPGAVSRAIFAQRLLDTYFGKCEWRWNTDYNCYDTSCDNSYTGTGERSDKPDTCPYCGREIREGE